jgi:hypothetical protein
MSERARPSCVCLSVPVARCISPCVPPAMQNASCMYMHPRDQACALLLLRPHVRRLIRVCVARGACEQFPPTGADLPPRCAFRLCPSRPSSCEPVPAQTRGCMLVLVGICAILGTGRAMGFGSLEINAGLGGSRLDRVPSRGAAANQACARSSKARRGTRAISRPLDLISLSARSLYRRRRSPSIAP